MRTPRRLHRSQRGAALVEFAVILPVLIILLFGVWEMGRIFDAWLVVTNAAREGARYAAAGDADTKDDVRDRVKYYVEQGYGPRLGTGDVHIEWANPNYFDVKGLGNSGPVTVTVRARVDIYAPIVSSLNNPFTVTGQAVMRQ